MVLLVSFASFCWKDIGSFVTRAINNSYEKHNFSACNKLGVITCIPKAGKPKQFLKKNGDPSLS